MGHSSPTSVVDPVAYVAGSATAGGFCVVLLGAPPAVTTPARAVSLDTIVAVHASSMSGLPSSCAPPPGEVGLVVGGFSMTRAVGIDAAGPSSMGMVGSPPVPSSGVVGASCFDACYLSFLFRCLLPIIDGRQL